VATTEALCQVDFPLVGSYSRQAFVVAAPLQKQLGQFLRGRRGALSLPAFARKLGISSSSLHRMEMGEQNVTLRTLDHLLKRLRCGLTDVFSDKEN
jgi:DNA-binding Xre family transcriptional regulator